MSKKYILIQCGAGATSTIVPIEAVRISRCPHCDNMVAFCKFEDVGWYPIKHYSKQRYVDIHADRML
jgi:hypothetical protein